MISKAHKLTKTKNPAFRAGLFFENFSYNLNVPAPLIGKKEKPKIICCDPHDFVNLTNLHTVCQHSDLDSEKSY